MSSVFNSITSRNIIVDVATSVFELLEVCFEFILLLTFETCDVYRIFTADASLFNAWNKVDVALSFVFFMSDQWTSYLALALTTLIIVAVGIHIFQTNFAG